MIHDSQNNYFRDPFGSVFIEDNVTLRFQGENIDYVDLILTIEGKNKDIRMDKENNNTFIGKFNVGEDSKVLFYYFKICKEGNISYYGNNSNLFGGKGEEYSEEPLPYQITVSKKNYKTPMWFKNSIIYQIFVDRFYNGNSNKKVSIPKKNSFIYGNWYDSPMYIKDKKGEHVVRWDFYGGNIKGITKKLEYIKDLGISVIYLNPIFEARSNHKYDTGDYKKIDPMFGNDRIFKRFIKEANKIGIYVILDGVFSHTGSDSLYFNKDGNYDSLGAYQSKNSPYYKWYNFKDYPDDYDCWWGVCDLPNVNKEEKSFKDYIIYSDDSVINRWMSFGIKGWRLDVADELPDDFIKEIKQKTKEIDKNSVIIGEVWEDASNKISYGKRKKYFSGSELDSVTSYPFRENFLDFLEFKIDAKTLYKRFMSLYENYPRENFYATVNLIGSHDVERINTMSKIIGEKYYNGKEDKKNLLKLITVMQFTFPGVPLIYYGDEVGLEGFKDPDNRRTYPWGKEDMEILNWYKSLTSLRNNSEVLRMGKWKSFYFGEDVYGFIRYDNEFENKNLGIDIIVINRNKERALDFDVDIPRENVNLTNIFEKKDTVKGEGNRVKINIAPLSFKIYSEIK